MNKLILCSFAILIVYCGFAQSACSPCPNGWQNLGGGHCVRVQESVSSYAAAQEVCANVGSRMSDILDIVGANETSSLYAYLSTQSSPSSSSYFWISGLLVFFDASNLTETDFINDFDCADKLFENSLCSHTINDTNLFIRVQNGSKFNLVNRPDNTYNSPVLCQMPAQLPPPPCQSGWQYLNSTYCVKILPAVSSFSAAQAACSNADASLPNVNIFWPNSTLTDWSIFLYTYIYNRQTSSSGDVYYWVDGQLSNFDAGNLNNTLFSLADGSNVPCSFRRFRNSTCDNNAASSNLFLTYPYLAGSSRLVNRPASLQPVLCQKLSAY